MSAYKSKMMTPVRMLGLMVGMFGFALASPAFGAATGGETLTNAVTVNYDNANGDNMLAVTATVDVTITQVYSLVWQNYGANLVEDSGSTLPAAGMVVQLRNAGNGTHQVVTIDNNHVNSSHGANIGNTLTYQCDVNGAAFGTTCFAGSFEIFSFGIDEAQGVIGGGGTANAEFAVTADLVAQVVIGDTIDINGTQYIVTAINAGTDTIQVDDSGGTNLAADIAAGDGIAHEVINFQIFGTVGSLPNTGLVFQEDHQFFFRATDDQTAPVDYDTAPASGFFEIAVVGPGISMSKYVRNSTNANNTGACSDSLVYNGQTYFNTHPTTPGDCVVEAVALDNLDYVIQIENATGRVTTACGTGEANVGNCAGPATAVTMADDFPAYTTLAEVGGSGVAPSADASCDGTIEIFVGDGTELIGDNEGAGVGDIEYLTGTGTIIYYYVNGDDGDTDGIGTGVGGTLGVNASTCFSYRLSVN